MYCSIQLTTTPINKPIPSPPTIRYASRANPSPTVGIVPRSRNDSPISRASKPVASFNRLSPSRMSTILRGKPTAFAIEVAAIASVVETTAPSKNPAFQYSAVINRSENSATPQTVNPTSPTASSPITTIFRRNSLHDIVHADAYSNGGRKTTNTIFGSSGTLGMRGTKLIANPASTSTIGYGTFSRRAIAANAATITSSNKITVSTA